MNLLTPDAVYTLARAAGFTQAAAVVMTAIAGAESNFDADAVGDVTLEDSTWGPSVGLWQIRSLKAQSGTGSWRDATKLKDPEFNARAAFSISSAGSSFTPWSTFTDGAYLTHLPAAQAASGHVVSLTSIPGVKGSTAATTDSAQLNLNPLDGFGIPGAIAGAATSDITNAADSLVNGLARIALSGAFVVAGLALIVGGLLDASKPITEPLATGAASAAGMAAMA